MTRVVLGVLIAFGGSSLSLTGVALQALDARRVALAHALRLSLARQLIGQRWWLLGAFLVGAGWVLHALALLFAPLTVVQPALGFGLIVLLIAGARMLKEHVGWLNAGAIAAIIVGVAGLAWAAPERSEVQAPASTLAPAMSMLGLLVVIPYLLRDRYRGAGMLVACSAGCAF